MASPLIVGFRLLNASPGSFYSWPFWGYSRTGVGITGISNGQAEEFISFVLSKYALTGLDELDQEKLPILLTNKYQSLEDVKEMLGNVPNISKLLIEFRGLLYNQRVAKEQIVCETLQLIKTSEVWHIMPQHYILSGKHYKTTAEWEQNFGSLVCQVLDRFTSFCCFFSLSKA